ncbi:MAG: hypothetical protein WAM28_07010 [Chlamydiales bacterium]
MKLVNKQTNEPIIEFEGKKTLFHNKFLEQEMRSIGILIPHGLRGVYHGKNYVRLEDEEFQKAFKEIYCLTSMNPDTFQWQD